MKNCAKVNTLVKCGVKMSKNDKWEKAKLFNIQKPSLEFKIFDMHSFGYSFWSGACEQVYGDANYDTF
jgi:hypothetical protein